MGLFSISPVQRFLDGSGSEHVRTGTQLLVFGFLRAMQAQNIYFRYGMHPLMREAMRGMLRVADSQRIGAGGDLLSRIGDDEESGGDRRVVIEPPEVAVATCAARMANLRTIPGVSQGISFGIDVEPTGPKTSWSVIIHRGPLPLLQIELSDITGFQPPKGCRDSIIESRCAHVVSGKGGQFSGGGDHLFLMLKRYKLFPYSKGNFSDEAVAAGQTLRRLCAEVWRKEDNDAESLYDLSSSQWGRKRFVRKFDQMLMEHAGSDNLDAILKEMGTRLESWIAACEY